MFVESKLYLQGFQVEHPDLPREDTPKLKLRRIYEPDTVFKY